MLTFKLYQLTPGIFVITSAPGVTDVPHALCFNDCWLTTGIVGVNVWGFILRRYVKFGRRASRAGCLCNVWVLIVITVLYALTYDVTFVNVCVCGR